MLQYVVCTELNFVYVSCFFNRRQMEISQKAAEEEERYKKEMEKYTTSFGFLKRSTVSDLVLCSDEVAGCKQ